MLKNGTLLLAAVLVFAVTKASHAYVAPSDGAHSPSTMAGIITSEVATGVVRMYGFNHFEGSGALAVCPVPHLHGCEGKEWITPQEAIRRVHPKAQYVGFQVSETRGEHPSIFLYYKMPSQ